MNEKIISELYHGNIQPSTKQVVVGSAYQKNQHILSDAADKLEQALNTEEKVLLENVMTAWCNLDSIGNEERFTEGFKLGARIMLEIFEKTDEQLKSIMG
ncbi:DUF6809 family protein [Chakrabartyella piscis]|uniref:DUF6809 family protein n=1 Tax=Chakrabartyella piscis TaxID=2918914 RepID=UPI0029584FAC|nr:DUF6809 family protein [Chakrabartyella piscis]